MVALPPIDDVAQKPLLWRVTISQRHRTFDLTAVALLNTRTHRCLILWPLDLTLTRKITFFSLLYTVCIQTILFFLNCSLL